MLLHVPLLVDQLGVLIAENLLLTLLHHLLLVCDFTCTLIVSLNKLLVRQALILAISSNTCRLLINQLLSSLTKGPLLLALTIKVHLVEIVSLRDCSEHIVTLANFLESL